MSNPIQVAVIVLWATLSACTFSVSNPALAGPVARSNAGAPTAPPDATQPATPPPARVYLFRGALGPIFSRGMDRLTKRLEEAGIRADVYEFTICRLIADQAIRDFRDNAAPIVLIGHSMGGLCALTFAGILKSENIPVRRCRCATSFLPMPRSSCGTAARSNSRVREIPCRGWRNSTMCRCGHLPRPISIRTVHRCQLASASWFRAVSFHLSQHRRRRRHDRNGSLQSMPCRQECGRNGISIGTRRQYEP
jgi:hypothetical protein